MSVATDPDRNIRRVDVDSLDRTFRRIYPLKIFLENARQFVAASAIGLILGAAGFFLKHAIALRGGVTPAPIEIRVFLVTAFASLVVVGYVSLWAMTVRNVWKLGGVLTLAVALLIGLSLLNTGPAMTVPAADAVTRLMTVAPLSAVMLLAVIGLTVAYYAHLIWVLLQAAFALALVNKSDRKVLRDLTSRQASTSFFSRFWGFPPLFKFARRSSVRFAAIAVLSVICALFFSVATALPLVLTGPLEDIARISQECSPDIGSQDIGSQDIGSRDMDCFLERTPSVLNSFMFPFGVILVCFVVGWLSQRLLQRLLCLSLETLQEVDNRQPVLFLRAFRDDQVPLRTPKLALFGRLLEIGRRPSSLDQLLLEEATPYGPVVGLGSPSDKRPPYGAARGYFSNESWQDAVEHLVASAVFIVICIDDTAGVWWEVEHLIDRQHLNKTLFLLHPRYANATENSRILAQLSHHFPDGQDAKLLQAPLPQIRGGSRPLAVIGVFRQQDGSLCILQSSTFSRFAYLMTLRAFIRQRLGTAAGSR